MLYLDRLLIVSATLLGSVAAILILAGVILHRAWRLDWHTTRRLLFTALGAIVVGAAMGAIVSGIAGIIMTPLMPIHEVQAFILYTAMIGAAFGGLWGAVGMFAARR